MYRAFALSQFSYCPFVWMLHDRTLNHKINHVHKRAMGIAYKDCKNDFGSLLVQSNSISIHARNLQLLMTGVFKTKFDLNPPFTKDIFMERGIAYNLRHGNDAQLPKARTSNFGVEALAYFGNKLWQYLPHDIKQSSTLSIFKWNGERCNCRLCTPYIQSAGFLINSRF